MSHRPGITVLPAASMAPLAARSDGVDGATDLMRSPEMMIVCRGRRVAVSGSKRTPVFTREVGMPSGPLPISVQIFGPRPRSLNREPRELAASAGQNAWPRPNQS